MYKANKMGGRSEEVTVGREHIGGVIGRGGSSIKTIQEESGARIHTVPAQRGTLPSLVIRGTKEQIEHAKGLIAAKVDELVRAEIRRSAWWASQPRKFETSPAKIAAKLPKREVSAVRNMFECLELDEGASPMAGVETVEPAAKAAELAPKVMTLDEYMAIQQEKKANSKHRLGPARKVETPAEVRENKRRASQTDTLERDSSPRPMKRAKVATTVTFSVGATPKIGKLKYQNYLDAMARKERREQATSKPCEELRRAEEKTVVTPTGRPLSAEAEVFVPSWLKTDGVEVPTTDARPDSRGTKRKGEKQPGGERKRRAVECGVVTPTEKERRTIQVSLKSMSEMASQRMVWQRDYKIRMRLQPQSTLKPDALVAEVTIEGESDNLDRFLDYLSEHGIAYDLGSYDWSLIEEMVLRLGRDAVLELLEADDSGDEEVESPVQRYVPPLEELGARLRERDVRYGFDINDGSPIRKQ